MNPIQAVSPDDQNVVELSESPGRRLRVLRQSKGWEIERIASQLHLRPHLVEALEHDRFHELPGPVFVMGYLRNYARLLGIDPEPLIGAYRAATPNQEPRAAWASGTARPEVGSGHILVRLVSLGLFLVVIAMLVLWWQNRPEPSDEPTLGAESPSLPLLGGDEPSDDGNPLEEPETTVGLAEPGYGQEGLDPLDAEPLPVTADTPDTPSPANLAQPPEPATPAVADSEPSAPPAGPTATATPPKPEEAHETAAPRSSLPEVVLSFSGTSWIDVRDAAGKVILTGEMRKGDRRVLKGEPPYSFVIGNAKAAALTVGEKPLDLSVRGRGGVARFKLDPDNPE